MTVDDDCVIVIEAGEDALAAATEEPEGHSAVGSGATAGVGCRAALEALHGEAVKAVGATKMQASPHSARDSVFGTGIAVAKQTRHERDRSRRAYGHLRAA